MGAPSRERFVSDYVAAKRARWIETNTVASPFPQTRIPEPSDQHVKTWTEEAEALATKKGFSS